MDKDEPRQSAVRDITQLMNAGSSHDCGNLSRVVMVRKTDQRVINHKSQKEQKCEVITLETIQTYKGHRPDRTVVFEKRDLSANGSAAIDNIQSSRTLKADLSKDYSSLTISTPNEDPLHSTISANKVISKNIYNGSVKDSNNNPAYGTPTLSLKNGRNSISYRGKSEDRMTKSTSNLRYSTPSPVTKRSLFSQFETDCLISHNTYRSLHNVPHLKLNKKLCRYAEEWAKIIAARGVLVHRNNSQYGENIFCSWSSICHQAKVTINGREPVEAWYSEISNHQFLKEPSTLKSGHFTQVVWRDSRELGVGYCKNRSGQVFVVANYEPAGNYIGSFAKNVTPIGGIPKSISKLSDDTTEKSLNDEDEFEVFAKAMLKHHNDYRKKHGAVELKITKELMDDAQQWAENLAREDKFTYRQNSQYGENLYCLWSSDRNARANAKDVCRAWYNEGKDFKDWNVEPKGILKAGQFSQMIWKSSKELGVGIAQTKNGKVLVVCSYYPRGNVIGLFQANMGRIN